MLESQYQAQLIKKIREIFGECFILKNDSSYLQGVPDLLILFNDRWAMLEVKAHPDASVQPNQDYYIDWLDSMSFAAYIYPENEREVLHALQSALQPDRHARVSKRKPARMD